MKSCCLYPKIFKTLQYVILKNYLYNVNITIKIMSRNRQKSCHEKEKPKKKCRLHRINYEKGRHERDIGEKNIRKNVWSTWLNFIRGHWCGRMKNEVNSLDIYTRALSADVFDIPIEPKSTITRKRVLTVAAPENCMENFALSKNDSYCVSKMNLQNKDTGERLMQHSDDHQRATGEATGGKNPLPPGKYFSEDTNQVTQKTDFPFPRLWTHSGHLRNSEKSNRDVSEKLASQKKIQSLEGIDKTSSEPRRKEKAEIYHRRQVKVGLDSLLDQLICMQQDCYTTEYKNPKEQKRLEFDIEKSMTGQKGSVSVSKKNSRQVSPAILVNIKPFKKQITQSDLQENFLMTTRTSELNSNQVKKTKLLEERVDSQREETGKETENSQLRCPVLKNQIITLKNFWDTEKEKPPARKEAPEHQTSENRVLEGKFNKDFCLVVGVYQSYNEAGGESDRKFLDEVLENFDGRNHNVLFQKNMRQFRKKIINGSIKGEEKETGRREPKSEKGEEACMKTESIMAILKKSAVILGIHYDLATAYNIVRTVSFVREEIHNLRVSQTVREICQCRESYFCSVIEKRLSNVTTLLIREMREIRVDELKTARILRELKYCLRNVEGVASVIFSPKKKASNIFLISRECATSKQPEPVEPQDNVSDLLTFLQEYSKLVEKSCSGHDLMDIEKILATVAKSFMETESKSDGALIKMSVLVENLTKDHRVVQILNISASEYLALIYQKNFTRRKCSVKSFSETDLNKRRKQGIILCSEISIMKDFACKEFRQRGFTSSSSLDGSQSLFNDLESISDENAEPLERYETGMENKADDKEKVDNSIAFSEKKKMLMFKSNSFPGEISTARDYRAQKSRLFKDLRKDFEKKIKSTEKGISISKGGNFDCSGSEMPIKIESDSARFQKYLASDQLKNLNESRSKKMFFIEQNAGELRKEVIAAFSTIKDLSEEKDSVKAPVVIMLSRK